MIKPMHDWIVLKRDEYHHPTLFVAGQRTFRGKVIAVGPGKWLKRFVEVTDPFNGKKFKTRVGDEYGVRAPMDVQPGDVIEFSDQGWEEREIEGEKYIFVRQDSVIGFANPEDSEGIQSHSSAILP